MTFRLPAITITITTITTTITIIIIIAIIIIMIMVIIIIIIIISIIIIIIVIIIIIIIIIIIFFKSVVSYPNCTAVVMKNNKLDDRSYKQLRDVSYRPYHRVGSYRSTQCDSWYSDSREDAIAC